MSGRLRALAASLALALGCAACARVGTPPDPEPRTGPLGIPIAEGRPSGSAAALPRLPSEQPAGTSRAPVRFAEVRGLWVVRFSLASPASARAVVERAARAGFNTLLVQVRGRGDAFYASTLEPRAEALAGQPAAFDPLAEIVAAAHARGLAVHAWMNVSLVTDLTEVPTDPRHIAEAHPEALMVPRALAPELLGMSPNDPRYAARLLAWADTNRERVEGLYVSPWSAAVRARAAQVAADLVDRYDLDGIHLDYIRYPGPDFDYSAGALTAFRDWAAPQLDAQQRMRLDRERADHPLAWADGLPVLWTSWRRAQMTALLERIQLGVKTRHPWVLVSAAVYPDTVEAPRDRLQDWPSWARDGLLDAVAPMAYAADDQRFRAQVGGVIAAAPRAEIWAGIGSYVTGLDGTLSKIRIARRLGTRGVLLFSYDWAVDPKGGGGEGFLDRIGASLFGR